MLAALVALFVFARRSDGPRAFAGGEYSIDERLGVDVALCTDIAEANQSRESFRTFGSTL